MKLTETDLRKIIRQELRNMSGKGQVNEMQAFDADKMRRAIDRSPRLAWIYDNEDIDLKTLYDREVMGHARMKRIYDRA